MTIWCARLHPGRSTTLRLLATAIAVTSWQGSAVADAPGDSPPEPLGKVTEAAWKCRLFNEDGKQVDGSVDVVIGVDPQGRPVSVEIPEETEPLLAQMARCTALKVSFKPAARAGQSVSGTFRLHLRFPRPPMMKKRDPYLVDRCYPQAYRQNRLAGRVVLTVTIAVDGSVSNYFVPEDAEQWIAKSAACVVGKLSFVPAQSDGKPIEATASLPIVFGP